MMKFYPICIIVAWKKGIIKPGQPTILKSDAQGFHRDSDFKYDEGRETHSHATPSPSPEIMNGQDTP